MLCWVACATNPMCIIPQQHPTQHLVGFWEHWQHHCSVRLSQCSFNASTADLPLRCQSHMSQGQRPQQLGSVLM